jgi:hypothetical protein
MLRRSTSIVGVEMKVMWYLGNIILLEDEMGTIFVYVPLQNIYETIKCLEELMISTSFQILQYV